jgi:hypothetical protein
MNTSGLSVTADLFWVQLGVIQPALSKLLQFDLGEEGKKALEGRRDCKTTRWLHFEDGSVGC